MTPVRHAAIDSTGHGEHVAPLFHGMLGGDQRTATKRRFDNDDAERKPGDKVRFTIFRFDVMRDMEFTLGSNDRREYSIQKVAAPVDAQRRLYKQYLNAEF